MKIIGTFLISAMISLGSRAEVVFMLQVKRRDLGLICSSVGTGPLKRYIKDNNLIGKFITFTKKAQVFKNVSYKVPLSR